MKKKDSLYIFLAFFKKKAFEKVSIHERKELVLELTDLRLSQFTISSLKVCFEEC